MTTLVRAYASMFLGFPHRTTRNYKALLRSVGSDIFHKDHRLEMHYVSAYAHYKLEYLFRSGVIAPALKPARYHLLYLFRLLTNQTPLPRPNSRDMARYCDTLTAVLWDDNLVRQKFVDAVAIVLQVSANNLHRDNIRTEPFTELIKQAALAAQATQ